MISRADQGGQEGGKGGCGRKDFLSAHRCPEVELLPYRDSEKLLPPPCLVFPEFTCSGRSEDNYLDVSSSCRSEGEDGSWGSPTEEREGSVSDWSEEDLSLHFSPSIILPSEDEESDTESGFNCVEVAVVTKVEGQEREGLKMVPKRQIHLKKKESTEKLQVILNDGPSERGGADNEVSSHELLCPTVRPRPDLLLRQHSMPASFCTRVTNSSDVDSNRVYRGLVSGASQGPQVGRSAKPPRCLQKSFSLDETKTKMASCIIKTILSKKMQVEQSNTQTSHLKKTPETLPVLPPPKDQQAVREGLGGALFRGPVHVVRDVRGLVKNTYNLSFCTATSSDNHRPTSLKVIGQEDSTPPTYQQAVGVKGHQKSIFSRGHMTKVAASLSQSHVRNQNDAMSHPMMQKGRGSEPLPVQLGLPPNPPQTQGARGTPLAPLCSSTVRLLHPTLPNNTRGQSPCGLPKNSAPPLLGPASLTPAPPGSSSTIVPVLPAQHPHLGKVSYIHSPLNYFQIQLQPPPSAPTLQLLRRSEEDQSNHFMKSCPPQQSRTTGDQEGYVNTATAATETLQQPLLSNVQGFLPAQVGSDLVDITGLALPAGALLSAPALCNMMLEPKSGQYYYVDTPPKHQRKMLLDPETGQFIQVLLPAASSVPNNTMFPVCCNNQAPTVTHPTATMLQLGGANPTFVTVMRHQPTMALSSLHTPLCLSLPLHTQGNLIHTVP